MSSLRVGASTVLTVLVLLGSISVGSASGNCMFDTRGNTMFLEASCTTESTIFVPDGYTLNGGGFTITATETSEGAWTGPVIENEGANANIVNVSVTACELACVCKSGPDRLQGIRMGSASGRVENNIVYDVNKGEGCSCDEGIGIVVSNPPFDGTGDLHTAPQVRVANNMVSGYQKGGIAVTGNVAPAIVGNQLEGWGPTDALAQNGIQVSYGATGLVEGNSVRRHWYTGASGEGATGIFVFEADDNQVFTNSVVDTQGAIAIEAWCWYAPSASRNRALGNLIDESDYGISISAYVWDPPFSHCGPTVADNTLSANKLSTRMGSVALSLYGFYICTDCAGTYDVSGNWQVNNWKKGFDVDVEVYGDPAPVVAAFALDDGPAERVRTTRARRKFLDQTDRKSVV